MRENTHKKTQIFLFVLITVLLGVAMMFMAKSETFAAHAAEGQVQTKILSQMSEDECIEFIIGNGAIIPDGWDDEPEFGGYVKSIIQAVEANPNYTPTANWEVSYNFVEDVKTIVNNHYGAISSPPLFAPLSSYSLQDNWVQDSSGNWVSSGGYWGSDNLWNYNCYAYALI